MNTNTKQNKKNKPEVEFVIIEDEVPECFGKFCSKTNCDCPVYCFQCSQFWRPSAFVYHHCKVEVKVEVKEQSLDDLFTALRNEMGAKFYDKLVNNLDRVHRKILLKKN